MKTIHSEDAMDNGGKFENKQELKQSKDYLLIRLYFKERTAVRENNYFFFFLLPGFALAAPTTIEKGSRIGAVITPHFKKKKIT